MRTWVKRRLESAAPRLRLNEREIWRRRALLASTGSGKTGAVIPGVQGSKQLMAASLTEPRELYERLPATIVVRPFAKPNDLKPRAIYPVDHWTSILESLAYGPIEEALRDRQMPITTEIAA